MKMINIKKHDMGAAVEDVQQRLSKLGYLPEEQITGVYDDACEEAVRAFTRDQGLKESGEVTDSVWVTLVDACFELGDRTLYLRMPYFHGNDVVTLQKALGALGFSCGEVDGAFGPCTELALRKFQANLGLFDDGIAGDYTYRSLIHLRHSWENKDLVEPASHLGFARVSDVLESHALCLFGTCDFTRSVASRMSNLALATNPASKIVSADSLSVPPTENMLLVHIVLPEDDSVNSIPCVAFEPEETMSLRLQAALCTAKQHDDRVALELPGTTWIDAGAGRSAQHFAISLLDALCAALAGIDKFEE